MPDPTFTDAPEAPSRAAPSTFSARTDAFLSWMSTFRDELASAVTWFSAAVTSVDEDKTAAGVSEENAAASAAAAAAYTDAEAHVPNAAYVVNNAVISNTNHQTYRCIVAHSGVATDPSADATNWVLITFDGVYDSLTGKPTLGTVADKNTGTAEGDIPILAAGGELPAVGGANLVGVVGSGLTRATKTTITNGATNVDIALPAGEGMLLIEGRGVTFSAASFLFLVTSTDGVTFDESTADYMKNGSAAVRLTVGGTSETEHSFALTARGANDAGAYFSISGDYTSGGVAARMDPGNRAVKEAVSHIRLKGGTFTGGEVFVSRVLEAS